MPDATGARWSPAQQSMLRELGCELFTVRGAEAVPAPHVFRADESAPPARSVDALRSAGSTPGANTPTARRDAGAMADASTAARDARPRRMLVVLSPDANWLRGPNAKLARGVLAALGVKEADVRGEPHPGAPALCFGRETPGAVHAPALEALRDARAKRALWPALRALRRRLREGAPS